MSDHWDFYYTNVDDKPASMFLDLGIAEEVPDESRPWVLWVSVSFQTPDEHGFCSDDESQTLFEIEDALSEAVANSVDGVAVGRVTTDGHRDFFFYAPSFAGFEEGVGRVMDSFPQYQWESGSKQDPEWELYQEYLYPSPYNWQEMQNRQVLENLQESGDSLEKERTVDHWASFPDEAARDKFAAAVQGLGYIVIEQQEEAEDDEADEVEISSIQNHHDHSDCGDECGHDHAPGFVVQFGRVDKVDRESINAVTSELWELAQSFGGDYDGWGTSVEQ